VRIHDIQDEITQEVINEDTGETTIKITNPVISIKGFYLSARKRVALPYLPSSGNHYFRGELQVKKIKINDMPLNSIANDIATLVNDFNLLLDKLR